MARVFLTGAKGQCGSEIELALLKRGHEVISSSHDTLDITDQEKVQSAIMYSKADMVINAAAYTNVERAETDTHIAYKVNALGARNVAQACAQANIPLIHISSDYVLSDNHECLHYEDDKPVTECAYGKSKLEGENYIIHSGCKHIIIRTSWVFGRYGRNFVKIMLSLGKTRDDIAVVYDQVGNPTPARPLAEALCKITEHIIEREDFNEWGIYHYGGINPVSWYDFAVSIFDLAERMKWLPHHVNVSGITSDQFPSKAKRPRDSRMAMDKILNVFGIEAPYWPNYLEEVGHAYLRECQNLMIVDGYDNTTTALTPESLQKAREEAEKQYMSMYDTRSSSNDEELSDEDESILDDKAESEFAAENSKSSAILDDTDSEESSKSSDRKDGSDSSDGSDNAESDADIDESDDADGSVESASNEGEDDSSNYEATSDEEATAGLVVDAESVEVKITAPNNQSNLAKVYLSGDEEELSENASLDVKTHSSLNSSNKEEDNNEDASNEDASKEESLDASNDDEDENSSDDCVNDKDEDDEDKSSDNVDSLKSDSSKKANKAARTPKSKKAKDVKESSRKNSSKMKAPKDKA